MAAGQVQEIRTRCAHSIVEQVSRSEVKLQERWVGRIPLGHFCPGVPESRDFIDAVFSTGACTGGASALDDEMLADTASRIVRVFSSLKFFEFEDSKKNQCPTLLSYPVARHHVNSWD